MIRYLTAGESHGRGLMVVVEGLPSGLEVPQEAIAGELRRRRRGFGRGPRMELETDRLTVWSGLRGGLTTGAPVGITVENAEWERWRPAMDPFGPLDPEAVASGALGCPRPGHADLAGGVKHQLEDLRNVLERASARSSAAVVAAGALAKLLLGELGVRVLSAVLSIGSAQVGAPEDQEGWRRAMESPMGCGDPAGESALVEEVRGAMEGGYSLGGTFLLRVAGLPPGIGSYAEWDRRLDGRLCGALMAIPGIKAVQVGDGFALASKRGHEAHDEIVIHRGRIRRPTNRCGGIEGGMSNGEDLLLTLGMKPIPTMRVPLRSVDLRSREATGAHRERTDVCAVPAASVVGEAVVALVIASAVGEQFGGDRMEELRERFQLYRERAVRYLDAGD
jgi:chorismate synthase